jgi:hypothetical protein
MLMGKIRKLFEARGFVMGGSLDKNSREGERRAFAEFAEKSQLKFEKWFAYQYSGQAFLCVDDSRL